MNETIFVTGGAGFIGSHTCLELLNAGYRVVVADNLINSKYEPLRRVQELTGKTLSFYEMDVCDETALDELFSKEKIDGVIHFAGLKAVGESVHKPLLYYRNNLNATISLLETMQKHGVYRLVFSSSATVYGVPTPPIREDAPTWCTNPYGWTKYMSEQILRDWCTAEPKATALLLRYFNPIGAHESGRLGEDPNGIPNNLLPYVAQVAVGKRPFVNVFGNDYNTPDGTGVRDYIHVVDLAQGHVDAIRYAMGHTGAEAINLGTGKGYSVLEIIAAYERAAGVPIPYRIGPRRAGDVDANYADPSKAKALLGWEAKRDIEDMCKSSYHWQTSNPNGYAE